MEKPHRRLDAWNSSVDLVMAIYQVTERLPKEERCALISQLRRAATSVPSNIAEGAARQTKKEFANYIHIAQGSLSELDTHLEIADASIMFPMETGKSLIARLSGLTKC